MVPQKSGWSWDQYAFYLFLLQMENGARGRATDGSHDIHFSVKQGVKGEAFSLFACFPSLSQVLRFYYSVKLNPK